jgi:hypothetical protein
MEAGTGGPAMAGAAADARASLPGSCSVGATGTTGIVACAGTFDRPVVSVTAAVAGFVGVIGRGASGVAVATIGAADGTRVTAGSGPDLPGAC